MVDFAALKLRLNLRGVRREMRVRIGRHFYLTEIPSAKSWAHFDRLMDGRHTAKRGLTFHIFLLLFGASPLQPSQAS
jgi:hypothetical protein